METMFFSFPGLPLTRQSTMKVEKSLFELIQKLANNQL